MLHNYFCKFYPHGNSKNIWEFFHLHSYIYIYMGDRDTGYILNYYLCAVNEIRQVVMVARFK